MVVVTKGQKQYGDVKTLTEEFLEAQDGVEELADQLRGSMAELHALQERFEKAVLKQTKTLKNIEKADKVAKKARKQQQQQQTQSTEGGTDTDTATTESNTTASASANATAGTDDTAHGDTNLGTNVAESEPSETEETGNGLPRIGQLRARLARGSTQHLMPCSGGLFVELLLGHLNVRFMRKSERLQFKTEYEKLKLKLAPGLVVLAVVSLYFEENRWVHMVLQLCLVWYYVTLAVRENILRVNGSNIKSWWIIHHYFTMLQGVLLLTWPNNASYAMFRRSLHFFGLYNAVLQIFQTRYQVARLYALRSLGMAGEMDVASSDSTQIHWSRGMATLLPLILCGQAAQAWLAFKLFGLFAANRHEWQILLLALLFTANFIGNLITTMLVLHEKRKRVVCKSQRAVRNDSDSDKKNE